MPAKRTGKLTSLVLNNKGTKLVSLLLAMLAWYAIGEMISHEKEITDVPIEIVLEDGWAVLDRSENVVQVTFKGSESAVLSLDREQVRVELAIQGEPELDTMFLPLELKHVIAPGNVRAVKVEPDSVYVSLDRESSLNIPVKPVILGQLPEGYELGEAVCKPTSVTLYGPRKRLDETESVSAEAIDLAGRLQSFKLRRDILPPSESWVARVEPTYVTVEVEIIERSSSREFTEVPILLLVEPGNPRNLVLSENRARVVIEGRAEILEGLDDFAIQTYVSGASLVEDALAVPVEVHVPPGTVLIQVEPAEINLSIEGEPGKTTDETAEPEATT